MKLYSNAVDVLPSELLAEVQKHWHGGYLWVPQRDRIRRREFLFKAIQSGLSAEDVAALAGISRSQVYRMAHTLGSGNPYSWKEKKSRVCKATEVLRRC
ncbi:hypothetical protein SDC9_103249 [bioreactor metagenome]|uniref:HTH iclR-type domain-containing protein n=1 Tax=bioreactor metagenome TaxID=1076179 RepID=A0A645AT46_9ZZZZ